MDDQYLRTRWETRIKPLVFADVLAANNPVTIFLGGQPGAGKTQGKNYALAQFPPDTVAEIIGDDFRRHHPDYEYLITHEPLKMPHATAPASGAWVGMCVEYAEANRISFLVEGTWRNAATVLDTARRAKELGRQTHAVVLAVPPLVSLAGIAERFYRDMLRGFPARWTPPTAHDVTVDSLVQNIGEIVNATYLGDPMIDRFTVTNRSGEILYDGAACAEAVDIFQEHFERPLTLSEQKIVRDTLAICEQGHMRFTADDASAADVLNRLRQGIE
ncbi:zeta toxin family protein [uncultured Mobiluncus sp.]|uniref:zeta toxin family protein n=1 Tax=uncultured Mobiluncus sp. TaxID=293425 RepID=UPI0025E7FF12|nr:zeta toxin family protein [uncultured Mobiluncus sp.]